MRAISSVCLVTLVFTHGLLPLVNASESASGDIPSSFDLSGMSGMSGSIPSSFDAGSIPSSFSAGSMPSDGPSTSSQLEGSTSGGSILSGSDLPSYSNEGSLSAATSGSFPSGPVESSASGLPSGVVDPSSSQQGSVLPDSGSGSVGEPSSFPFSHDPEGSGSDPGMLSGESGLPNFSESVSPGSEAPLHPPSSLAEPPSGDSNTGGETPAPAGATPVSSQSGDTPAPPTPAGETPAPPTPAGETPAPPTPVGETPAPPTPVGETPVPPTPAGDTPAPPTPAGETPAPPTPPGQTPAPPTPTTTTATPATTTTATPATTTTVTPATTTTATPATTTTPAPSNAGDPTTTEVPVVFTVTPKDQKGPMTETEKKEILKKVADKLSIDVKDLEVVTNGNTSELSFKVVGSNSTAATAALQQIEKDPAQLNAMGLSTMGSAAASTDTTSSAPDDNTIVYIAIGASVGGLILLAVIGAVASSCMKKDEFDESDIEQQGTLANFEMTLRDKQEL